MKAIFYSLFSIIALCSTQAQPAYVRNISTMQPAAASASVSFTDNFDRADANPMSDPASGGTWLVGPGAMNNVKILSNDAAGTGATSGAAVATPTYAANQLAEITLDTTFAVGVCVRYQPASGSCYLLYAPSDVSLTVYKVTDTGTIGFSAIGASFAISLSAGDRIRLNVTGSSTTTLEVFVNDVSQGTRDDSSSPYTSGQPGIYCGTVDAPIVSFTCDDL